MQDVVQLTVRSGAGGRGKVSFRREKYVPKGGPDGGDGGRGGDVVVRATKRFATLKHLSNQPQIEAKQGEAGGTRKKHGSDAPPTVIEVPVGTQIIVSAQNAPAAQRQRLVGNAPLTRRDIKFKIYETDFKNVEIIDPNQTEGSNELIPVSRIDVDQPPVQGEVLIDLLEDGQEFLLCQGGFGGRGNTHFKSSTRTTPRLAENGTPGEERRIWLELRLLADIGMVGLPSVGKSTLLSVLTKARPKIAAYPFTTLEPQLGQLQLSNREVVLADLPGLIEGASQGKGLGTAFLRHVTHCRALWFVLAVPEEDLLEQVKSPAELATAVWQQYQLLWHELLTVYPEAKSKKHLVVLNKIDILPEAIQQAIVKTFSKHKTPLMCISGATGDGLAELKSKTLTWFTESQDSE